MPHVHDITGDIGKLRSKRVLPSGEPPTLPREIHAERKMAFNAISFSLWTLIVLFFVLQFAFLVWLAS